MIEIEVDCNSDRLIIYKDGLRLAETQHITHPVELCELLEILFSQLSDSQDEGILNVRLIKIDEDTKTTVGEW